MNTNEFIDDRSFNDCVDEYDYYTNYDDDDSNDDDYIMSRQRAMEEARILKEKREEKRNNAYKARISMQLKDCGKVLEGKLCWLKKKPTTVTAIVSPPPPPIVSPPPQIQVAANIDDNIVVPAVITPPVKKFSDIIQEQTQQEEWETIRRKNAKVINEEQSYNKPGMYHRSENHRYTQSSSTQYNNSNPGMCKHVLNGVVCPFGDKCRFSHVVTTTNGSVPPNVITKSRKIWMCKHVNNCLHGKNCIYAHSIDEVRTAVSKCSNCNRVKRISDVEYKNTVTERKCMRLHHNESIENFIKRTS